MSRTYRRETVTADQPASALSRQRLVIGSRRSRPNALKLIFGPGRVLPALPLGACRPCAATRSTSSGSKPVGDDARRRPRRRRRSASRIGVEQLVVGQRVGVELAGPQLGRRRLGDRVLRDRRRSRRAPRPARCASAPARQTSVFGHVLDRREAADRVAVDRRVADRELALVAGGEHEVALGVGQRHQRRAAHPRLDVLLGEPGQRQRRRRTRRPSARSARRGSARRCARRGRRRRTASARRSTRSASRRRSTLLAADRVGRDRGDHRRVDAAGQAEHDRAEAVLARRSRAAR